MFPGIKFERVEGAGPTLGGLAVALLVFPKRLTHIQVRDVDVIVSELFAFVAPCLSLLFGFEERIVVIRNVWLRLMK